MATNRLYSFRYLIDVRTALDPWREKLGADFDRVAATLNDRDRALEDYLSLGVGQGFLGVEGNSGSFSFGTAEADITGCAVTVTVPAGRLLRVSFHANVINNDFVNPGGNNTVRIRCYEGVTLKAFRKQADIADSADTTGRDECDIDGEVFVEPAAGTHTYKITAQITNGPSQNMTISAADAYIAVEDIGPANVS